MISLLPIIVFRIHACLLELAPSALAVIRVPPSAFVLSVRFVLVVLRFRKNGPRLRVLFASVRPGKVDRGKTATGHVSRPISELSSVLVRYKLVGRRLQIRPLGYVRLNVTGFSKVRTTGDTVLRLPDTRLVISTVALIRHVTPVLRYGSCCCTIVQPGRHPGVLRGPGDLEPLLPIAIVQEHQVRRNRRHARIRLMIRERVALTEEWALALRVTVLRVNREERAPVPGRGVGDDALLRVHVIIRVLRERVRTVPGRHNSGNTRFTTLTILSRSRVGTPASSLSMINDDRIRFDGAGMALPILDAEASSCQYSPRTDPADPRI